MNQEIRALEPRPVWNKFADLNAVPRPSKKEEKVIEFMVDFGRSLGLETIVDKVGNVIIRKPATNGMEDKQIVVLQSHLDMVHQKNNDTEFNFDTQGIEMYVDGDWVKAKGTTLGADNGLGVATMMAILESDTIEHPELEALFTIDEETGMTGAIGLEKDLLRGSILLNLDTEDDDEIGVGCAGGVDVTATRSFNMDNTPNDHIGYRIEVKGLQGGHSGMDIIKGLGNANKIMNRILFEVSEKLGIRITEIDGGGLRNAIPRESCAEIALMETLDEEFVKEIKALNRTIKAEYKITEPNLAIEIERIKTPASVIDKNVQEGLLRVVYSLLNGVYRMSPDIEGLVETSNNLARVLVKDGKLRIGCLTRSSVDSAKWDLTNSLKSALELIDCKVEFGGNYPGWQPNMDSEILGVIKNRYIELNNEEPIIAACHAGLECGILGQHYPNLDMVSFGPNIRGAHSPDERASISSVKKYWKFIKDVLNNIPDKIKN